MHHLLAATSASGSLTSVILVTTFWIILLLGLYLLPWGIAQQRGATNQGRVLLVNVLLGWTVVGWIAALVMAVQAPVGTTAARGTTITFTGVAPAPAPAGYPPAVAAGWYPDPWGQARLRYHDGATWTPHVHA